MSFVNISRCDIILNLDLYVCTVFWSIKCCFIINLSWVTITFIYSRSQVHYITFRLITLRCHDFLLDLVVSKKGYVGENIINIYLRIRNIKLKKVNANFMYVFSYAIIFEYELHAFIFNTINFMCIL